MKKLKLTINGEVKTFNLPENGEYKCEVEEHYVPKVGDCVKIYLKNTKYEYFGKINQIVQKEIWLISVGKAGILYRNLSLCYDYNYIVLTQITPEELKAKYAEFGYDWDYESDTVKHIKWMPKVGDECWGLDSFLQPRILTYYNSSRWILKRLKKGLIFPTEAECQKFADHCMSYINNKK
jgi:hypothetical protein